MWFLGYRNLANSDQSTQEGKKMKEEQTDDTTNRTAN